MYLDYATGGSLLDTNLWHRMRSFTLYLMSMYNVCILRDFLFCCFMINFLNQCPGKRMYFVCNIIPVTEVCNSFYLF